MRLNTSIPRLLHSVPSHDSWDSLNKNRDWLLLNQKVCDTMMIQTHQQQDRHGGKLIAEPGVHLGHTSSSELLPSILHPTTPVAAGLLGIPRTWLPVRSHYYDLTFSAECLLLGFCNVFTAAIKTGARTQEPLYIKSINNNGSPALFKLHKGNCIIPLCGVTP